MTPDIADRAARAREVGATLRAARGNLSVASVAEQTRVSKRRLDQIESGFVARNGEPQPTFPSAHDLETLCQVLGLPIEETNRLMGLAGYPPLRRTTIVFSEELPDADRQFLEDLGTELAVGRERMSASEQRALSVLEGFIGRRRRPKA